MMQTIVDRDARVKSLEHHALQGLAQIKLDKLLAAAWSFSVTTTGGEVAEAMVSAMRDLKGVSVSMSSGLWAMMTSM